MLNRKKIAPRLLIRKIIAVIQSVRFSMLKLFFGSGYAMDFLKTIDKISLVYILKKNGAKIGVNSEIESGLTVNNCKNFLNLIIGNNVHIGKNCFFDLKEKIIIEDNVTVSMQCTFITHIDLGKSELSKVYPKKKGGIIIGKNTYIGANATILMNVVCGMNCIVAAGSVVTKSINADTFAGGVPAKPIKKLDF